VKEIIVTTQAELDALPKTFTEYTRITIKNTGGTRIKVAARGNSSVVARGNSSVEARENSSVEAWGNSSVVARENSSVEAWGNSSVVARGNCVVRKLSSASKAILHGFAVCFVVANFSTTVESRSIHAHVQIVEPLVDWFENNSVEKTDTLVLFKRVSADFKTQENTENETLWTVGTTVTIPVWSPDREECGRGKFHACSRPYFCDEFREKRDDRYIAVEVKLEDTRVWPNPSYPHKIAFREGKVLYECDRFGRKK
jgi:hypothetical protein